MDLGLTDRRAIVAASTAGLGFGAAAALVAEGARVAICGGTTDEVARAAARLGPAAYPIDADVSTVDGARRFVEHGIDALGGVDILIANGGGPPTGTFATTELEAYAPAIEKNLLAVVAMCQTALPLLRAQRWGRVIAVTSVSVRQPLPKMILSNTARAGVTGFLKTVALEVAADGVTVNSVQPGLHDTEGIRRRYGDDISEPVAEVPAGVAGDPADFGAVVAFLCSEQARFVTGAHLPIDGGTHRGLM
ncbi:MAG: SDR family oxidoreductase [Ilumatobacteraceae bacterium]